MGKILKLRRTRSSRRLMPFVAAVFVGITTGLGYAVVEQRPTPAEDASDRTNAVHYSLCGRPPHRNCVIDGDTFYLESQPIRVMDIDAPETHPSRCAYEADLGERATRRLHELMNAGPVSLVSKGRDVDQYGRKLRVVMRDGKSIGSVLVSEGLARKWTGRRQPWCT